MKFLKPSCFAFDQLV